MPMSRHIIFYKTNTCLVLNCMHEQHVVYVYSLLGENGSKFKYEYVSPFTIYFIRVLLKFF